MGVKSKKKAKTRLDAYYRLAKDQGYRARSAFKLIQLNRKYDFLAKSRVLVDLCAAPGGWCQVAAKYMPVGSKIVGVDLVPIAPIRGCKTFVGDITDDKTRKIIVTWLKKEPVDCVIHDGAPNVGGVWSRDLYDQNALVLAATKMACSMLKPDGWFVTKVFRSQDFQKLIWVFKQLFTKVEATKPLASRMESAEIFVVCAGYMAPKSLDPQMFNPQRVFSDVGVEKVLTASGVLATPKTNVPQGYDEFATVTHHVASFSDFLRSNDPKQFLKSYQEIRFTSDEDKVYLKSKSSKRELVYLCGDLQQVSDADAKRMLRWREQILREQAKLAKEDGEEVGGGSGSDVDSMAGGAGSDDEDGELKIDLDSAEGITKIARELLEIRKRNAKEMKKKQKRVVDRKLKQIKGLINYDPHSSADHLTETDGFDYDGNMDALDEDGGMGSARDSDEEADFDGEDFTVEKLALVNEDDVADFMDANYEETADLDNDPLNPVVSVNLAAQQDWDMGAASKNAEETAPDGAPMQLVEGEEYYADVDNYGNYIPAERSSRVKLYEGGLEGDDDEDDDDADEAEDGSGALLPGEKAKKARGGAEDGQGAVSSKKTKWEQHHRNVDKVLNSTFPVPKADAQLKKRNAKRQRALEEERITMNADNALDIEAIENGGKRAKKRNRFESDSDADLSVSDDDDSFLGGGDSDAELDDYEVNEGRADSRRKRALVPHMHQLTTQELVRQQRKQVLKENKEKKKKRNPNKKEKETDFEEIPVALTDPNIRARTLAIAQKMLDPKARRDILDASVNRYVFNDDDDLPDWFVKDEQRNCKVILPVTAEEIEAQRERFRELNSRPSKKVMEAMGRKRRKAQRMLHSMIERGKADPRAREKAGNLSVRKLMRSQVIKGAPKKKQKYMDTKSFGQLRREKQRMKRQKKGGRKS